MMLERDCTLPSVLGKTKSSLPFGHRSFQSCSAFTTIYSRRTIRRQLSDDKYILNGLLQDITKWWFDCVEINRSILLCVFRSADGFLVRLCPGRFVFHGFYILSFSSRY